MNDGKRTTYTLQNIVWGFVNRGVNIICPFIIRTILIYIMGSEYLGLNTLFNSILQILNLAEMGLSSAIVYSMYEPIAKGDTSLICALLALYKKVYRIIGIIILIVGLVLIPVLPNLVMGEYPPDININVLYIIYLLNTVISYWFFAYKSAIWNAAQRVSVVNNIATVIVAIQSVVQIIVLLLLKNYYLFIIIIPFGTIMNNCILAWVTQKTYPEYICEGNISKELSDSIKQRIKGLFISRICTTTRNSLDSVFISSMLGLTAVAIYGNYYYIMGAVYSVTSIIITSMTASVGNSIVTSSVEKNYQDMRKFNFSFSWIVSFCAICMICLYQPFMKIWVGERFVYPFYMVILFTIYFYVLCLGSIRSVYHDAAGLWWEARYRALAETVMNILLNYILTLLIGVAGTIISTILSILIINYGYGTKITFRYYFKGISTREYYLDHLKYSLVTIFVTIITYLICEATSFSGVTELLVKLLICLLVPNMLFFIIYYKNNFFQQNLSMLRSLLEMHRK